MKALSQFSAIYGQLFCCDCPGGLTGIKCDNRTGVVVSYPLLAHNNYAWVAGVLCFLLLSTALMIATVLYCRRKRQLEDDDVISIIKFQGLDEEDLEQQTHCLVETSYNNPSYLPPDKLAGISEIVGIPASPSEDSLFDPVPDPYRQCSNDSDQEQPTEADVFTSCSSTKHSHVHTQR